MATNHPDRYVIATTIDSAGASYAKEQIETAGLGKQIEVRLENVTHPTAYPDGYFDFIYARLILHYLSKLDLSDALHELHRILKVDGKLFVVVRSLQCPEASGDNVLFDPVTCLTTYFSQGVHYSRYFHSEESIQRFLVEAGFTIHHIHSYPEQLCIDFQRTRPSEHTDILVPLQSYLIRADSKPRG